MTDPLAVQDSPSELFSIAATPVWVDNYQLDEAELQADRDAPLHYLYLSYQDQVSSDCEERYSRRVFQVNDASKIEDASQTLTELTPQSEAIAFHHCRIYRKDKIIDCLEFPQIRALHREMGLERQYTSDRMTVELLIDDLREGDVVDIASTVTTVAGEHPLHGRFYHAQTWMKWGIPIDNLLYRIVNRTDQSITVHHLDSANDIHDRSTIDAGQDERISRQGLLAERSRSHLPHTWWDDCVVATTTQRWEDISSHLYEINRKSVFNDDELDPSLIEEITEIDWSSQRLENVTALVRFVQNQIRYRAESTGIHTHTPRSATETLRRRTGDCKAKSALLVVLLSRLGISAELALVNASRREGIRALAPSPYWFNHMVVRFEIEGRTLLVDPTIQKQGGTLHSQTVRDFRWCLPLIEGGSALVAVDSPISMLVFKRQDTFDLEHDSFDQCTLQIERTFREERADNMRFHFDSNAQESLVKDYLDYTREDYSLPLEIVDGIKVVEDDLVANQLRTIERYKLIGKQSDLDHEGIRFRTSFFDDYQTPKDDDRPFYACRPGRWEHEILVKYGSAPSDANMEFEEKNPLFHYQDSVVREGNNIRSTIVFEAKSEIVTASDVAHCREAVKTLQERSTTFLPLRVHREPETSFIDHLWYVAPLLNTLLIVFIRKSDVLETPWAGMIVMAMIIALFVLQFRPRQTVDRLRKLFTSGQQEKS